MNKNTLRILYFGFVGLFIVAGIFSYKFLPKSHLQIPLSYSSPTVIPTIISHNPSTISKVIRVVDGDTIEIEDKKIVRYIGINTPETKHPNKSVECFGKEANVFNQQLVEGKFVQLEKDVSESDKYKRLLRYVWVLDSENATQSGIFVNDYLVRQGYAYASTFPPDVQYSKQFVEAEREAKENNRGLWNMCNN